MMDGIRALTTTVVASTQVALTSNLNDNTTINLGDDIFVTSVKNFAHPSGVIIDHGQAGLVIDGQGLYEVNGQDKIRCFYISGKGVNVVIQNLVITKGSGNGGGLYIRSEAEVLLKSCTITMNDGIGSVVYVGGGMYITSATVSLINCAITNNIAHRGGGIEFDQGRLLLAGCLFYGNNDYGADDLQLSNGSYVTVLSTCPGDSYNAGQGALNCHSCSTTYPADLLSGECTACPTLTSYSCCGAWDEGECTITNSSTICSEDELWVCGTFPIPKPAPSMLPTPLPLPAVSTNAPTSFLVLNSSSSTTFTVLVIIVSTSAIVIAIMFRCCFAWKIRNKSSSRSVDNKEDIYDIASPFFEALHESSECEIGAEHIYSGGAREGENGKMMLESASSEVTTESREITSTYGADQTFGSNIDHRGDVYAHDDASLEKLMSHLCRHGLGRLDSLIVAKYLSVSFGVRFQATGRSRYRKNCR